VRRPRPGLSPGLALTLVLALAPVLSAQRPAAGDARIELVRELAIGSDTAGPEYEFAGLGHAAVTRSGTVFVTVPEGSALVIRKFDTSGRFRGAVGRWGAGPGEYRYVEGLALVGDTALVVLDRYNGRVVIFDTAGAYRRSFPIPATFFSFPFKVFAVFADGAVGVRTRTSGRTPAGTREVASVLVRYRPDGTVLDSVRLPPEVLSGMVLGVRSLGARWAFPEATVFTPLPRGGLAVARTTAYRVEVSPAGAPAFVIERSAQALPLEGAEREEWQAMAEMGGRGPRITIPRRKPIIRELDADAEGRIWVSLYTRATRREPERRPGAGAPPSLTWWEHNAYDVFDPRGTYLGRIDLPPFSKLVAVLGSRIWVAEETDEGSYVLVRYRMRMPQAR